MPQRNQVSVQLYKYRKQAESGRKYIHCFAKKRFGTVTVTLGIEFVPDIRQQLYNKIDICLMTQQEKPKNIIFKFEPP